MALARSARQDTWTAELNQILVSEVLLARLLNQILAFLDRTFAIETGQFLIFEHGKLFKVAHFGPAPDRLVTVPELRQLNRRLVVDSDQLEASTRAVLRDHHVAASLALKQQSQLAGWLLLGPKTGSRSWSKADLDFLTESAPNLTIAILKAMAYEVMARDNLGLKTRTNQTADQLKTATELAKQVDRDKDDFIAMVAHQLRTPLTTIKGYLAMLNEGDAGRLKAAQQEFVDQALAGSDRMVSLISDLINVARLSAGRFLIEIQPTDLTALVSDEVEQLRSHAEVKRLRLEFKPPATKLPAVNLDEGKTRQVIMNFLDNAIYYTKAGEVQVGLETDPAVVRFTVRDTGIGVPEAERPKLFTKFYRASNAKVVRPDGTGLGLYLAKRVIEDQGGKIIFETDSTGSTFGFELPLKRKD